MKYFIVYSKSGAIEKSGQCPDQDFVHQGPADQLLEVDQIYSFNQGYVKDGKFVEYPLEVQERYLSELMSPMSPLTMGKTWSIEAQDWV